MHASPFAAREDDIRADAVLLPGAAAGEVRMRLAAQGASCELTARLDAEGTLVVPAGQLCPVDLASDRTEGRAEARVLSGGGRIREDVLHLELTLSLSGAVRIRSGPGALGRVMSFPGSRRAPIAFAGEARGRATGRRDRSRAAQ